MKPKMHKQQASETQAILHNSLKNMRCVNRTEVRHHYQQSSYKLIYKRYNDYTNTRGKTSLNLSEQDPPNSCNREPKTDYKSATKIATKCCQRMLRKRRQEPALLVTSVEHTITHTAVSRFSSSSRVF